LTLQLPMSGSPIHKILHVKSFSKNIMFVTPSEV
jgi:hypothetical protein